MAVLNRRRTSVTWDDRYIAPGRALGGRGPDPGAALDSPVCSRPCLNRRPALRRGARADNDPAPAACARALAARERALRSARRSGGRRRASASSRRSPPTDAELAAELRRLLAADARGQQLLDQPLGLAAPTEPAAQLESAPERAGPFRLVGQLGRGGMADVYAGERDDGAFEQRVAIKVLRRGLDTDDLLARFRRERQLPRPARAPGDRPAARRRRARRRASLPGMERVDGQPIDLFAESGALSIEQRLRPPAGRLRRGRVRAPQPGRPPRPQAVQRAGLGDRRGQAARLRYRQAPCAGDGSPRQTLRELARCSRPPTPRPSSSPASRPPPPPMSGASERWRSSCSPATRPSRREADRAAAGGRPLTSPLPPRASTRAPSPKSAARPRRAARARTARRPRHHRWARRWRASRTALSIGGGLRRRPPPPPRQAPGAGARGTRLGYRVGKFVRRHRIGVGAAAVGALSPSPPEPPSPCGRPTAATRARRRGARATAQRGAGRLHAGRSAEEARALESPRRRRRSGARGRGVAGRHSRCRTDQQSIAQRARVLMQLANTLNLQGHPKQAEAELRAAIELLTQLVRSCRRRRRSRPVWPQRAPCWCDCSPTAATHETPPTRLARRCAAGDRWWPRAPRIPRLASDWRARSTKRAGRCWSRRTRSRRGTAISRRSRCSRRCPRDVLRAARGRDAALQRPRVRRSELRVRRRLRGRPRAVPGRIEQASAYSAANPTDLAARYEIGTITNDLGRTLRKMGRLDEAIAAFERALAITEEVAQRDPGNHYYRSDLAACHGFLGRVHEVGGTWRPRSTSSAPTSPSTSNWSRSSPRTARGMASTPEPSPKRDACSWSWAASRKRRHATSGPWPCDSAPSSSSARMRWPKATSRRACSSSAACEARGASARPRGPRGDRRRSCSRSPSHLRLRGAADALRAHAPRAGRHRCARPGSSVCCGSAASTGAARALPATRTHPRVRERSTAVLRLAAESTDVGPRIAPAWGTRCRRTRSW